MAKKQSKGTAAKAGAKVAIDLKDLKAVFGNRLEVACVQTSTIPGTKGSLMIPANEPCPVEPHNHDRVKLDKSFQRVIILKN